MNKSELINSVAEKAGISKSQATDAVDAVVDTIKDVVKSGDKLAIPGILSVEVRDQPARTGRNPATGATIDIPAKKVVKLKAGKTLQDAA